MFSLMNSFIGRGCIWPEPDGEMMNFTLTGSFSWAVHDLNPRALGPNVQGFVQAQSWLQDLAPVSVS